MRKLIIAGAVLATALTASPANAEISALSKRLAYCEGAFLYATQLLQLQGNPSGANNLLWRYTRIMTANMWLNVEDDVVGGDTIAQFKAARAGQRETFDANREQLRMDINNCNPLVAVSWTKAKERGIDTMDGLTIDQFQEQLLFKMRQHLGL